MEKIPARTRRLFWDVNRDDVDPQVHRSYVIKRIMDYGDMEDVRWMMTAYTPEQIVGVLKKSRGISRKSATFWAAYFNIPRGEVECLKESYPRR